MALHFFWLPMADVDGHSRMAFFFLAAKKICMSATTFQHRHHPENGAWRKLIFAPFFGQRFKVILTAWNTMVMLRWCQPEGDTQVVLGSSAVLAA